MFSVSRLDAWLLVKMSMCNVYCTICLQSISDLCVACRVWFTRKPTYELILMQTNETNFGLTKWLSWFLV